MSTEQEHFDAARKFQAYYDETSAKLEQERHSLSWVKVVTITGAKLCAT
jgi:hypothetical protein